MPGVIGRPAHSDASWAPDLAIPGLTLPPAVLIEVLIAGHFAGNITRRRRPVFAAVTRCAPLVPGIRPRSGFDIVGDLISAAHDSLLAGVYRERLSAARNFAITDAHRDGTGLCVGIGAHPAFTRAKHSESHTRRVDFEILALPEMPHAGRE